MQNNYRPSMSGTVTHLDDPQPGIDALGEIGRAWLDGYVYALEREIRSRDTALAADYERGELK